MTCSFALPFETLTVSVTGPPYVTIGVDAASETDGGGPETTIVPVCVDLNVSRYLNVPATLNSRVQLPFGLITGDANCPPVATTWRFTVSLFTQVMLSPLAIVTFAGANPPVLIVTVFGAAAWAAGAATASAAAAVTRIFGVFIGLTPSRRYGRFHRSGRVPNSLARGISRTFTWRIRVSCAA